MKRFLAIAAILGFLAVAAGAFGAHALEARLDARMLQNWETAAKYQFYHALALIGAGWVSTRVSGRWPAAAGWAFFIGTLIFSGSLYIMALTGQTWLGAVTPLGGLTMMLGWFCLFMSALKLKD